MILWKQKLFRRLKPDDEGSTGGGGDDGASQISGADTIGSGNDARLAMYNRINDQNDAARADELADVNDDGSTSAFLAPTIEGAEPEVDPNADPVVLADPLETGATPDTPPTPRIKVNGVEVDLTPELIEKAQKIASGDKYLEDAVVKARTTATPAPAVEPAPLPPQEDVDAKPLEEELALVRAIQMGTEEEAVVALRKLRSMQRSGVTAEDVGRIADERLTFNTAIDWFNTEYADLIKDDNLHAMVLRKDADAVKAGDKRAYKERYKAIGDEVRGWRDGIVKEFAPAPTPAAPAAPVVDKTARKANAPTVPVAANTRAKPAPDDSEPDETTSGVIAKMAQARGGPQWARN